MKLLFHENTLALRGTTQAVFDYAHFAETLLGHDVTVCYNARHPENDPTVIDKFDRRFSLIPYDHLDETREIGADLAYVIKVNRDQITLPGKPTVVHEVFQRFEPHGDVYAYVSEWLAQYRTGGHYPFVPHIVTLPPGTSQRTRLGIPKDAFVFGRYGGYETFDLQFVKDAIAELLADPDVWFVFVNTAPFIEHPRALFLDPVTQPEEKSNFIVTCDAMIHARFRGESFGLAIAEFLFHNRPVLAWRGGKDGNHRVMLKDTPDALYADGADFLGKARKLLTGTDNDWASLVAPFAPELVMQSFSDVFIERKSVAKPASRLAINLGYRARRIFGERVK